MTTGYPRTRSQGNTALQSPLIIDFITGGTDSTTGNFTTSSYSKIMSDYVVPGYSSRVKRGEVFNNPMSFSVYETKTSGSGLGHYTKVPSATVEYYLRGPLSQHRAQGVNVFSHVAPPSGWADDDALSMALSNIDRTPSSHTESVLEVRETIALLRNPLSAWANLAKSFQKDVRKVKNARNSVKRVADVYTQYRFGFSPLVREVHEILASFDQKPPRPPDRRVSHGRKNYSYYEAGDLKIGTTVWKKFFSTWSENVSVHSAIMYEVSNPVYDWRWKYGLRNKDLPEGFWNIVPLSFMVDRAYDVSSFVRGVTNLADPAVKILSANTTRKAEKITSYRLIGEFNTGWSNSVTGETIEQKSFTMTRDPVVPSVYDAIPKSFTPTNLIKDLTSIADLVSLIIQRIK